MDFIPEAHAMLMVYAGTPWGTPLRMEICRATFGPPPACRALPKMVSSTRFGATPARSMAACAATTPRSAADFCASAPPNLPMGVRTADTMKTSCKKPPSGLESALNALHQLFRGRELIFLLMREDLLAVHQDLQFAHGHTGFWFNSVLGLDLFSEAPGLVS